MSSMSLTGATSGSGLDVQATVDQLIYTERAPERLWQTQQSALNRQASALRTLQSESDSLEDAINDLKDFTGVLASRAVSSTDTSVVTASADTSASSGTHTLIVKNLATYSSRYSKAIADSNFKFGTNASLSLNVGSTEATQTFALGGKTLQEAAAYINDQDAGIRASVVTDATGSRLSLVSETIGAPGSITLTQDSSGLIWEGASDGQNAQLVVDGIPIQAAGNSVTGVIAGVTLTLAKQDESKTVTLTVGPDTGRAKQAIGTFVSRYNSIVSDINAQFTYNQATKSAGVLAGDSTIRMLQGTLLEGISYTVPGNAGFESLRSIGIEMQNDGTLTINNSVLDDAVQSHYHEFQNFFQSVEPDGFALQFGKQLGSMNDSVNGAIVVDLNGIENTGKDISDRIDDFEVRIAARRQTLLDEYSRIDTMLRQFSATQSQLTAQLGSLNSK